MFILSSIYSNLEIWSVNQSSTDEDSGLKVFENIKRLSKLSNKWGNDLLRTNVYKTLELLDNHCWWCHNWLILFQQFLNETHFYYFHL